MKRRDFIKNSVRTAGIISFTGLPKNVFSNQQKKYANDVVALGNSGIKVSRLAMGTGSNGWGGSSNQTRKLGLKGLSGLLNHAYDRGVYFWDSADQYGSHAHLKEALKTIPREKVVILTKTRAKTEEEMKSDLDRFRKEVGTDYLDIVLLHAITDPEWPVKMGHVMNVLSKAREETIIRAHGISCHSIGALRAAAESDWVQVDLVRYNPAGSHMDDEPKIVANVIKKMKKSGKGIVGMKVFGNGKLTDRLDECLNYHLSADFIHASTIGIESIDQFDDLLKRIPAASVL
jgi:aryl-alcohol dehydrogenase-like predicted oxidoreductase